MFAKTCKTCQKFKKRKTLYEYLPPKNIAELKACYLVHVDLIVEELYVYYLDAIDI